MHTKDRSVPRALVKPDSLPGFAQLLKKRSENFTLSWLVTG